MSMMTIETSAALYAKIANALKLPMIGVKSFKLTLGSDLHSCVPVIEIVYHPSIEDDNELIEVLRQYYLVRKDEV